LGVKGLAGQIFRKKARLVWYNTGLGDEKGKKIQLGTPVHSYSADSGSGAAMRLGQKSRMGTGGSKLADVGRGKN